jgi:3-deoxy-D-manno-octulosonic acid (KDO) 8-phosphate synthase
MMWISGIPTMRQYAPTDVTHSLQQPNQSSGVTCGRPDMIENHCPGIAGIMWMDYLSRLILILQML